MNDLLRIPMVDARAYDIARHVADPYHDMRWLHAKFIQDNPHCYCLHERGICLHEQSEPMNVPSYRS